MDPGLEAAERLARRITAHLPERPEARAGTVEVSLTDNRHTMISVRRRPGPTYLIRLHGMFADCDSATVRAIARFVAIGDRRASATIGRFIDANHEAIRPARRAALEPRGRHHDLAAILADLNARYFGGTVEAAIGWGRAAPARGGQRSMKLGSYAPGERLIRIHPALDRDWVPRYFVESIVFHEMLHEIHGLEVMEGRRRIHSPAFRADERRFQHHALARAWERTFLDRLLRREAG